jgi:hypothetical protein
MPNAGVGTLAMELKCPHNANYHNYCWIWTREYLRASSVPKSTHQDRLKMAEHVQELRKDWDSFKNAFLASLGRY